MGNRLVTKLNQIKKTGKKIFCAYVTLGFPNLSVTEKTIIEFEKAGVDVVELGFPFSDPLADGPTIQYASDVAIRNGVSIEDAFCLVEKLRKKGVSVPIIFFSYLNPILHFGIEKFSAKLQASGFDGALVPDLPVEEGKELKGALRRKGLSLVYLVAPTTDTSRMKMIARESEGFIYYVALRGVTGARSAVPADLSENVKRLKRLTPKPVLVGFGVSKPDQARAIASQADGIIVGSAIVDCLRKGNAGISSAVRLVSSLKRAAS